MTDPSKKDGKLTEITDQKSLVKEHLVEAAGEFGGDDDEYGNQEDEQEPAATKFQRKEGMNQVGKEGEFEVIGDNRNLNSDNAM